MVLAAGLLVGAAARAQVTRQKVGSKPTTIDPSAVLDVESTNQGFLLPRMTTVQRDAIVTPATGLQVFNTTTNQLEVNVGNTTVPSWVAAAGSNSAAYTTTSQAILKTNANMTGGGTVSFINDTLKWSSRFIVISNGRGTHFSTNGYYDITMPTSGTPAVFGGAVARSFTAKGIRIDSWRALYYALPIGGASTSVPDSFKLVGELANFVIPEHWVLVALRNADNIVLKLGTGVMLEPGQTWTAGSGQAQLDNTLPLTAGQLNVQSLDNADTVGYRYKMISQWQRPAVTGVKHANTAEWYLGAYDSALSSQTSVALAMGNGNTDGTDVRAMTINANGNVGLGNVLFPTASVHLPNIANTRRIVLWENGTGSAGNDTNFHGFGINPFTLRYQVPDNQQHLFFVNKDWVFGVNATNAFAQRLAVGPGNNNGGALAPMDLYAPGDSVGMLIRNSPLALEGYTNQRGISFGDVSGNYRSSIVNRIGTGYEQRNGFDFYVWRPGLPAAQNAQNRVFVVSGANGGQLRTSSSNGVPGLWLDSGLVSETPMSFIGMDRNIINPAGSRQVFGVYNANGGTFWQTLNAFDNGQVAIGTSQPNASAKLDVSSTTGGFLPPRMTAAQRDAIQFPADGLTIYNTDSKCLNVFQANIGWFSMCTNAVVAAVATYTNGTQNCGGALAGSYAAGFDVTGSNTKSVTITVATAGSYSITTNTVNGVRFSASGVFTTTGVKTIVLNATGTATAAGSFNYTVTYATGVSCQFGVTYVAPTVYSGGTQNCGGVLAGTYNQSNPMNSANTKTVSVSATAGSYNISTDVQNGVSFSAQGTFASSGAQTIVLTASGTPTAAGTFTYTVPFTTTGINCSFNVTYNAAISPVTVNCAGITSSFTPAGNLTNGTAYTGTITIPYSAGNSTSYPAQSFTSNGLTFTRPAGTYTSSTGNVIYNITGTYTGTTGAALTVTVNVSGSSSCTAVLGDAIRGALSTNLAAYNAAATDAWVAVTAAEYAQLRNTLVNDNIGGASDADLINTSSSTGAGTGKTIGGGSTHAGVIGNYVVAFAVMPTAVGQSTVGMKVKTGTAVNAGYVAYGGTLPTVSTASATTPLYFVIKKPTAASNNYLGVYTGTGNFNVRAFGTANFNEGAGDIAAPGTTTAGGTLQIQDIDTDTKQW